MRLLIIDDDRLLHHQLKRHLRGHSIRACLLPREVNDSDLRWADVVLIDWTFPPPCLEARDRIIAMAIQLKKPVAVNTAWPVDDVHVPPQAIVLRKEACAWADSQVAKWLGAVLKPPAKTPKQQFAHGVLAMLGLAAAR